MSWLKAFDAAGRRGSFKEAARELHVTPSSVSHQIRDLEKLLGVALFVRKARGVALTRVGEEYLRIVGAAFDDMVRATERVRGSDRAAPLRIGMLPFMASEIFVPALGRLAESLPGVEFAVESRIHLHDLHSDDEGPRLDAVVRYGDGRFEGLAGIELSAVFVVPIGSPDRLRQHPVRGPEDLARQPLVVLDGGFEGWRLWGRAHGVDLPGDADVISFDSYASAMRAIEQGVGLGLGLLPLIQSWVDDGRVEPALDTPVAVPDSMWLVFVPGGAREEQIRRVGGLLREILVEGSSDEA